MGAVRRQILVGVPAALHEVGVMGDYWIGFVAGVFGTLTAMWLMGYKRQR